MAYQFADGFDNYGNAYVLTNGYPWDLVQNVTTSTADFRFTPPGSLPGGCAVCASGTQNLVRKNLSSNQATIIAGFGVKFPALPAAGVTDFFDLWDVGGSQCCLTVNSSGALQFYRGNNSPLGGGFAPTTAAIGSITANGTVAPNVWYGMAVQITVGAGTAGSVALYLNGSSTPIINSTGLNNSGSGNAYANQVSIGPSVTTLGNTTKYDDFYCFDGSGSSLNASLLGDARILTKMPSGAGTYTNWTPTGLATNWQNAAVQPPSLADYNANNVAATKDSYATQLASLAVPPYFVVARASMERDDAGPHTPSLFVRSGSVDAVGVVTPALSAGYLFYDAVFRTDPSTGLVWTGPGADNAQVGVIEG